MRFSLRTGQAKGILFDARIVRPQLQQQRKQRQVLLMWFAFLWSGCAPDTLSGGPRVGLGQVPCPIRSACLARGYARAEVMPRLARCRVKSWTNAINLVWAARLVLTFEDECYSYTLFGGVGKASSRQGAPNDMEVRLTHAPWYADALFDLRSLVR